ncbi:MAG: aromatic-ring-hydroxylating dioxygenase subunit beta [Thermaurantiacus sp.]
MSAELRAELAGLVEDEARLLDDRAYEAWLAMFAPDCRYWVPVSADQDDPGSGVAHFHDDKQLMAARCHRLANPRGFGAEPAARTAHVVSGIRLERVENDEAVVSSSQIVLEHRERGGFEADTRTFGGRVTHRFRRHADSWLIVEKRVDLINSEGSMNALAAPF